MKKLNSYLVEEELISKNLQIFTPKDLMVMFVVSRRAVEGFLYYNLKKGIFIRFKKGLYGLKRNLPHDYLLANQLYSPSYVSLETALAFYNLIPETVYAVTSITPKSTREFTVMDRLFEFRKIKKSAYGSYFPQKVDGQVAYLATAEKAVVDYLYFVFLGKKNLNDRLNWEKIDKEKLKREVRRFAKKRFTQFVQKILP